MKRKLLKKEEPKSTDSSITVKAKEFSNFLGKIYLGSLLNECVLKSVGKEIIVEAIDPTNIIFLTVRSDVDISNFGDLGIGEIQPFQKYISDCPKEEIELIKKEDRIKISYSGIDLDYLLTNPTLISTNEPEMGKMELLIEGCNFSFNLTKEVRDSFLYMVNLLKTKTCSIKLNKGEVLLTGGLAHEHQFKIPVGKLEEGSMEESFTCSFYSDYVKAVFSVLDFRGEELPTIMFQEEEYPLIINSGDDYWAIHPLRL